MTYADYTASGRSLAFLEDFIRAEVLPRYANTHTEASGTGLQTTRLREDARRLIRDSVGGDDDTVVIFTGSGSTAAIDKLIGILGAGSGRARRGFRLIQPHPSRPATGGVHRPLQHHSNEISWRETIADVVTIPEDADGHIDLGALRERLEQYSGRPKLMGSFSAASNVTGIVSDTWAISELLHEYGAFSFLGLRGLRAVRRHRDVSASGASRRSRRTPPRTRSSSARTSSSGGRERRGSWSYAAS